MLKAYTLVELLISITLMSLMALLGIIAFNGYGKSTVYAQKVGEVESLVNQLSLVAKNPEKDALAYCVKVNTQTQKISLFKSIDIECRNTTSVREISLSYEQKFVSNGSSVQNNFLICDLLSKNCSMKKTDTDKDSTPVTKNNYLFSISDNARNSNFFVSNNPFLIEVK